MMIKINHTRYEYTIIFQIFINILAMHISFILYTYKFTNSDYLLFGSLILIITSFIKYKNMLEDIYMINDPIVQTILERSQLYLTFELCLVFINTIVYSFSYYIINLILIYLYNILFYVRVLYTYIVYCRLVINPTQKSKKLIFIFCVIFLAVWFFVLYNTDQYYLYIGHWDNPGSNFNNNGGGIPPLPPSGGGNTITVYATANQIDKNIDSAFKTIDTCNSEVKDINGLLDNPSNRENNIRIDRARNKLFNKLDNLTHRCSVIATDESDPRHVLFHDEVTNLQKKFVAIGDRHADYLGPNNYNKLNENWTTFKAAKDWEARWHANHPNLSASLKHIPNLQDEIARLRKLNNI